MTVHPLTNLAAPTLDAPPHASERASQTKSEPARVDRLDRRVFFWLMAGLTVAYLLLQNGYWVRAGDGEVYLAIGRSLLRGEGFVYNGNPVGLVPPGWPAILAVAMWVSPAFGFLKLIPMASLLVFYACMYRICRRFAGPAACAVAVGMTAFLYPILPLSFWFHSDGAFCGIAGLALLLAVQIGEGRDGWGRIALLCGLMAASISVRWQGIIWWPLVGGALLGGRRWSGWRFFLAEPDRRNPARRIDRQWVAVGVTLLVTLATFVALRHMLRVAPDEINRRYNTFMAENYGLRNKTEPVGLDVYWGRFLDTKSWLSSLLWEMAARSRPTRELADEMAVAALVPMVAGLAVCVWRRQWLWLGAVGYCLVLIVDWTHPIARYIAPIAPLLLLAAWIGVRDPLAWGADWLDRQLRRPARLGVFRRLPRRWPRVVPYGFLAAMASSVVLFNGAMYAMEVRIARSGDRFEKLYDAGFDDSRARIGAWLRLNAPADMEVASTVYTFTGDGPGRKTLGPRRVAVFLADRPVMDAPDAMSYLPSRSLIDWAAANNVRYYLFQGRTTRFLHFRHAPWDPPPPADMDMDWHLYLFHRGRATEIFVDNPIAPTAVPGLENYARQNPLDLIPFLWDQAEHAYYNLTGQYGPKAKESRDERARRERAERRRNRKQ